MLYMPISINITPSMLSGYYAYGITQLMQHADLFLKKETSFFRYINVIVTFTDDCSKLKLVNTMQL